LLWVIESHDSKFKEVINMATEVTVPMVGKIVGVSVKVGDTVAEDDQIATLEAMKMEMPIVAPVAGVIKEIKVEAGQEVEADAVLAIIG
jgi:acetyl-CoA carboxylase biotin carboxyl carrier protein